MQADKHTSISFGDCTQLGVHDWMQVPLAMEARRRFTVKEHLHETQMLVETSSGRTPSL
jgi:hypothetical protein